MEPNHTTARKLGPLWIVQYSLVYLISFIIFRWLRSGRLIKGLLSWAVAVAKQLRLYSENVLLGPYNLDQGFTLLKLNCSQEDSRLHRDVTHPTLSYSFFRPRLYHWENTLAVSASHPSWSTSRGRGWRSPSSRIFWSVQLCQPQASSNQSYFCWFVRLRIELRLVIRFLSSQEICMYYRKKFGKRNMNLLSISLLAEVYLNTARIPIRFISIFAFLRDFFTSFN